MFPFSACLATMPVLISSADSMDMDDRQKWTACLFGNMFPFSACLATSIVFTQYLYVVLYNACAYFFS
jgi:hypothetical protein